MVFPLRDGERWTASLPYKGEYPSLARKYRRPQQNYAIALWQSVVVVIPLLRKVLFSADPILCPWLCVYLCCSVCSFSAYRFFARMQGNEQGQRPTTAVQTTAEKSKFDREVLSYLITPEQRRELGGLPQTQVIDCNRWAEHWNEGVT